MHPIGKGAIFNFWMTDHLMMSSSASSLIWCGICAMFVSKSKMLCIVSLHDPSNAITPQFLYEDNK